MKSKLPDFDTLVELAKNDPIRLESIKQAHINEIISAAPTLSQPRLRGLQFQIDAKRQSSKNALKACITISAMMRESFDQLRIVLNEGEYKPTPNGQKSATILPFKRELAAK
ncbi:DUF3135 domain-containing protein [Marinibactrum halimedae]|uniref:DUF3135 domain-containing protein n=1 Tax=Marinibactrum halimedae TaxID=1444977 RepID=A0AA37T7U5_9GAMM|nr:DUF3135 domain-containing protein [Marinibactrum halimedae]MCD9460064.1 DUF3135 domain-containing protein [Marinibactrum halimedae]GLS26462.1 hypothetical protein GCM10007877_21780 [Marinibactrum halimedae]